MAERSIQIEEDLPYQQREWMVQRIAWAAILLLIVATAAGLFGDGVLSRASVGVKNQLRVDFERFVRNLKPTSLTIHTQANEGNARIWIDRTFLQVMKLDKIVPEPERIEVGEQWLSFEFAVNRPGEITIKFDVTPETAGLLSAGVGANNNSLVTFWQWVYP